MKDGILRGDYQLVYITPELLIGSNVCRKMLTEEVYEHRLKALVVDEAHTVKKWYVNTTINLQFMQCRGQSFRRVMDRLGEIRSLLPPDRLGEIRSLLPPSVKIMALTATATNAVRCSVTRTLGMDKPVAVALSPCKANLVYNVGKYTTVVETFKPLLTDKCPRTIMCTVNHILCVPIFRPLQLDSLFPISRPHPVLLPHEFIHYAIT